MNTVRTTAARTVVIASILALSGARVMATPGGTADAATRPAAEAGSLQSNTWLQVSDDKTGGTIGPVVYVPQLKGAVLYGYPAQGSSQDVDLFVTAKREWQGQMPKGTHQPRGACFTGWQGGRPKLPCINRDYWLADQACYVPTEKRVLYFAGGSTFYYDPAAKAWENLNIPFDAAPPDVMLGTMAWDPVKKRVILFGGGYISAHKGAAPDSGVKDKGLGAAWTPSKWTAAEKRATWAFDPAKKAWGKVVTGSEKFRAASAKCLELDGRNTDLMGAIRGVALEYGDLVTGKKPAELAEMVGRLAADVAALAKELAAGVGCEDAYEAGQFRAAAVELEKAKASLETAKAALSGDDGWKALHAAEKARWEFFDAVEAVATSPLPRYYASMVTDTKNQLLVLFGGHGGTMVLGDTWVFDPAKDQWRKSKSAARPSLSAMPAMSFDEKAGLTLLLSGWVYDAAADEWKTVKLSGGGKLFYPWSSVAYDPDENAHVVMTAAHGTFGDFGPRRVALLRLDASDAATPTSAPADRPVWRWLDSKYTLAWSKLPKDQAEYKARVAEQKKFLDGLPANAWVKRNTPYDCQSRGYGSFCYDWDRDQLVNWGGGHSAYMGNEVSQYDVKGNFWMESWAPDLPPWPFGAPDGPGWHPPLYHRVGTCHGYYNYTYCSDLKKVVFWYREIYDPDRMRWTDQTITSRKPGAAFGVCVDMSGAPGLMGANGAQTDFAAMTIGGIAGVKGAAFAGNDRMKAVFDTKRKRILWFGLRSGQNKICNELWALPLDQPTWVKIEPKVEPEGAAVPGMAAWGNCYSAKHDVMVILPGSNNAGTWVYDCGTNVLKRLGDGLKTRQGSSGVIYDEKQDVFISVEEGSYGTGPVSLHFMRYKP